MKYCIVFFFVISVGCFNNGDSNDSYVLIKVDSSGNQVASKIFVSKFNPLKKLIVLYWNNGKIQSRGFFYGKKRDGINENFYITGSKLSTEVFENGLKNGIQKTYYLNGKIETLENYDKGKKISVNVFDSSGNEIK